MIAAGCGGGTSVRNTSILTWGGSGNRAGQFRRPRAIGVLDNEVYVADKSGRVQVFGVDGEFRRMWRMPAFDNGTPTCISFGRGGTVLIPDTHYSAVREYSPAGELLREWGEYGTGEGQFIYPTGIVEDRDGLFYVSEYGMDAERIQVFDNDLNFVRVWGEFGEKPGQMNRLMDMVIDGDDHVYAVDSANHRLQKFTKEGELLTVIGGLGEDGGGMEFPFDAALAPDNTLLACEYGNCRLSRFSLEGEFVEHIGELGRGPRQFNGPRGVAVSDDYIFVADTDNDRIQRLLWERTA